jgi:hypothetical protein
MNSIKKYCREWCGAAACFAIALFCVSGCASAMLPHSSPASLPVAQQLASTNDSPIVGWLRVADALNKSSNPTSTQEPVGIILGACITGFSALGGWLARHKSAVDSATAAKQAVADSNRQST